MLDARAAENAVPYSDRAYAPPLSTQAFIGQKGADFAPVLSLSQDNWRDVLCRHAVIPYAIHDGIMVMAASTYADATKAIAALGIAARPVSVMIAPRSDILTALSRRYASSLTHHAANGLREAFPDSSAATRIPHWMQFILLATFIVFLGALFVSPWSTIANLWVVFIPYFTATALLRTILIVHSMGRPAPRPPRRKRTPIVSILIPVYGEAESLPALVHALCALDYPVRALDILILLEADDTDTIAEAQWLTAGTHINCLVVPTSAPRTKPKAMNFALPFVRGEFVGIFDAEDAPHPDQISRAVATLDTAGDDIVCAQARLSHYNPEDNLLTRCVAMEYALWFDVLLAGMSRTRLPMPLGGTSLYFRGIR